MRRRLEELAQPRRRGSGATRARACAVMLALALTAAGRASAVSPTDDVRQYTDRVLQVLQTPGLSPDARRAAVRTLAVEVFDAREAAQRALGPHWQRRTPAEREEFVVLFRDLLDQTYV